MAGLVTSADPRLLEIARGAIGPEPHNAVGYGNPVLPHDTGRPGTRYVATMKTSCFRLSASDVNALDPGTMEIGAYDGAESADANIGQINMITASSFCGTYGALWGYDFARAVTDDHHLLATPEELFTTEELNRFAPDRRERIRNGPPLVSGTRLFDAAEYLFGHHTPEDRRHPPLPGSMVTCANKSTSLLQTADMKPGETSWAWAILAVTIAKDPATTAHLFIEDTGESKHVTGGADGIRKVLKQRYDNITKCIAICQSHYPGPPRYDRTYIGASAVNALPGQYVTALACAPYVLLAQKAVPNNNPADLITLDLNGWNKAVWPTKDIKPISRNPEGMHIDYQEKE